MTTIAIRGHGIAADRHVSGSHKSAHGKLHRLSDGSVVGMAGATQKCSAALAWLREGGTKPTLGDEFAALRLHADGRIEKYEGDLVPMVIQREFYAIGSGADYAMGAMARGASAEQAVLVAGMFDEYTAGCDC